MGVFNILAVAFGGAAGAYGRYAIGVWASSALGKRFFYGTLIANVLGCFIIGVMFSLISRGWLTSFPWHDLVAEGFCGALTTFSTFSMDTFKALNEGAITKGVANLVISMVLCLMAAALGVHLGA